MNAAAQLQVREFQREVDARTTSWPQSEPVGNGELSPSSASEGVNLAKEALDNLLKHRASQARSEYEKAIPLLRPAGDTSELADALANLATTVTDHDRAVSLYEEARQIYQRLGNVDSEAVVTRNLATHFASFGQGERAEKLYGEAIELARQIDDSRTEGLALTGLAILREEEGRLADALGLHEQALQRYQKIRNSEEGVTYAWIAALHAQLGNPDATAKAYQRAIERFRAAPRTHTLGEALVRVGRRLRKLRMMPFAHQLFETALSVYVEVGDRELQATVLRDLGTLHADMRDLATARAFYELASFLHQSPRERRVDAMALGSISAMYSELGQLVMAREIELRALQIHRELGNISEQAMALGSLASCEERLGNLDVAETLYKQGIELARQSGHREHQAICLMGLAGVYHQTQRSNEGRELHDVALAIATKTGATDVIESITFAKRIVERDTEVRARSADVRKLLNDWMADDSGYDESTWPKLERALDRDRLSDRKLFHG